MLNTDDLTMEKIHQEYARQHKEEIVSQLRQEIENEEIMEVILGIYEQQTGSLKDKIDTILNGSNPCTNQGHGVLLPVNVYPDFGVKTDRIFPSLLAVVPGRKSFEHALTDIVQCCEKMRMEFEQGIRKDVVVIFTQWIDTKFKELEPYFLNRFVNDQFNFVFLLVTAYGISRIPFVRPSDRIGIKPPIQLPYFLYERERDRIHQSSGIGYDCVIYSDNHYQGINFMTQRSLWNSVEYHFRKRDGEKLLRQLSVLWRMDEVKSGTETRAAIKVYQQSFDLDKMQKDDPALVQSLIEAIFHFNAKLY